MTIENPHPRAIMTLEIAGEGVTQMVKATAVQILSGSMRFGRERQQLQRNSLSEMTLTNYDLCSMLAVAIDRLAVHEALTPTPLLDQTIRVLRTELGKRAGRPLTEHDYEQIARAVLDR